MDKPIHPIKKDPNWGSSGILTPTEKREKREYDKDYKRWKGYLLKKAHYNLTVKMGRPEYSPNVNEIESEVNRIIDIRKELEDWDGWGMSPRESKEFGENLAEQVAIENDKRAKARYWLAIYKDIQGNVNATIKFRDCDESEAFSKATHFFGEPDCWNTFIHVKPISPF